MSMKTRFLSPHVRIALVILAWYATSISMSLVNKAVYGVFYGGFPFPVLMTLINFVTKALFASFFIHIISPRPGLRLTWDQWRTMALPVSFSMAGDVSASNLSLLTISLSFYTMVKPFQLVFVLIFAVAMGLEKPSMALAATIVVISVGTALASSGELEFSWVGFLLVIASTVLSGFRWAMSQKLLQGVGQGLEEPLDPIATMYITLPAASAALLPLFLAVEAEALMRSDFWELHPGVWLPLVGVMLGTGVLSFMLILLELQLVQMTSSLTCSIAGVFKELCLIAASVLCFGDSVSLLNIAGVSTSFAGVFLYNWQRAQAKPAAYGQIETVEVELDDLDEFDTILSEEEKTEQHEARQE